MKTVILCGGRGTRLDEHGTAIPKGLFPIGDRPLIWHICKIYSQIGFNEFVLCLGYLKERYSEYFGFEVDSQSSGRHGRVCRMKPLHPWCVFPDREQGHGCLE